MLVATLVAAAGAWLVAMRIGTDAGAFAVPLLLAMGIGSLATLAPVVLDIDKDHWGVVVLGSGVGRSLIVLAICFSLQPEEVSSRPLFMGALTFVLTLLIAETVMSIRVLSSIERHRVRTPGTTSANESTSRNPA